MPDDKQHISAEELNRLLDDLSPAAGSRASSADDLDRTLADILRPGRSAEQTVGSAAANTVRPSPAVQQQQPAPVQPAAAAKPAEAVRSAPKRENIPRQERRPFVADTPLQLDDKPLVSEDFRRFFTTSVTPDALFSSKTDVLPGRDSLHRQAVKQQPQPTADESDAPVRVRSKGGFWGAVRNFFTVEDTPEDEQPDPQQPLLQEEALDPTQTAPAADTVEELPPQKPASAAPADGEKPAAGPDTSTAVFQPVGVPRQPAADPRHATTVFEPVGQEPVQTQLQDFMQPADGQQAAAADAPKTELAAAAPDGAETDPQAAVSDAPQWDDDDYYDPAQQLEIASALKGMVLSLTLRAAILALLAGNALYFGLAAAFPALPQPDGLVTSGAFTLAVLLGSLLIGGIVSLPVLKAGFAGLLEKPSTDSFAALSWAGALLQVLVLLLNVGSFDGSRQVVYACFALLALFTCTLGKRSLAAVVKKNFEKMTDGRRQYAVAALIEDAGLVRRLSHGLGEAEPCLLVSRPTGFYENFLHQSFAARKGDDAARPLARLLPALALVAGVLGVVLGGGFVQPFAAVLCIGCPLSMVLVSAVPNHFMSKSAHAIGAILPGPKALEDLGQANVVVADAKDLFPAGSVTLKGMKVFGEHRIDLAILYAASLLVPNCPTLRDIFLNIIQDRTELLYQVENLTKEIGCGFDGWVDGRHLLVGNRGMMVSHGVQVPPADYEQRYTREGRYSPVYLAVNGQLGAMFVVGYRPDTEVKELLDEVYISGLSLLVTSDDFNLTGDRINTVYGIPEGCIKVLGAAETERLAACTGYCSRATGAMLHTATSLHSYLDGIRIAAAAAGMEKAACTLQTAAVIVSAVLVIVLTCTGGLGALGVAAVLLYQLAWLLLTLLLPFAKQY